MCISGRTSSAWHFQALREWWLGGWAWLEPVDRWGGGWQHQQTYSMVNVFHVSCFINQKIIQCISCTLQYVCIKYCITGKPSKSSDCISVSCCLEHASLFRSTSCWEQRPWPSITGMSLGPTSLNSVTSTSFEEWFMIYFWNLDMALPIPWECLLVIFLGIWECKKSSPAQEEESRLKPCSTNPPPEPWVDQPAVKELPSVCCSSGMDQ